MPTNRISLKNTTWILLSILIVVFFLAPIFLSDYRALFLSLINQYPLLAPLVIIIFRFLGVVAAPLPGAPVAFASMALLPWPKAWFYNFLGAELGAIAAFFLARFFRQPVVARFAPLQKINQWQEKISQTRQFWSFVALRAASLAAFDFVSYAAGLTKLSFLTFLAATLLVDIPATFIFFYLGGWAVQYSFFLYSLLAVISIIGLLVYGKNHYQK